MSTISKIAVYDPRLQQDEPAYAVQKGALSVSVAPFQAISANSSQMTFQVLVPSLNVFVDRKLQLSEPSTSRRSFSLAVLVRSRSRLFRQSEVVLLESMARL
jgi:hypothetical protein